MISSAEVCDDFGDRKREHPGGGAGKAAARSHLGMRRRHQFHMPVTRLKSGRTGAMRRPMRHRPSEIFGMMEQLSRLAENYRCHGGIHSAAVGADASFLLYAEDLGRHNTLDRIAGEALFKGVDLSGTMLVTSGRVSTELVGQGGNARHFPDRLPHLADRHGGEDVRGGGNRPDRLRARRPVHYLHLSGEDRLRGEGGFSHLSPEHQGRHRCRPGRRRLDVALEKT